MILWFDVDAIEMKGKGRRPQTMKISPVEPAQLFNSDVPIQEITRLAQVAGNQN